MFGRKRIAELEAQLKQAETRTQEAEMNARLSHVYSEFDRIHARLKVLEDAKA